MELFTLFTGGFYLLLAGWCSQSTRATASAHWLLWAVLAPWLAHGWLLHQWIDTRQGQNLSLLNMLSLCSWVMLLMSLGLCWRQLQSWLLSLSLVFAGASLLLAQYFSGLWLLPVGQAPGSLLHIVSSIAAFSLIALAAIQSLLQMILNQRLKRPLQQLPIGMPPLQRLERLRFRLLGGGYALLSVSLVSGWLYVQDFWAQHLLHKSLLALLAWLILSGLLLQHLRGRVSGRVASIWTISAFGLLFLAYLGSKFVLEVVLQRLPS